jgi:hypothetical protein
MVYMKDFNNLSVFYFFSFYDTLLIWKIFSYRTDGTDRTVIERGVRINKEEVCIVIKKILSIFSSVCFIIIPLIIISVPSVLSVSLILYLQN